MGQAAQQTILFLVQVLFGLYSVALLLRVLLHSAQADFYNPIVNAIIRITGPVVKWPKKCIPNIKGLETSAVLVLLAVVFIKLLCISALNANFPNIPGLVIWAVGDTLSLCIQTMFYLIIINAIISWIPNVQPTIQALLGQLTNPLLRPARKFIPTLGGLDLSPLAVLILLQVVTMLIVNPIMRAGMMTALGIK
jgi:YggT family protein